MLSGLLFLTTVAQFLLRLSNHVKDGDGLLKADVLGPATLAVTVVCNRNWGCVCVCVQVNLGEWGAGEGGEH